MKKSAAKTAPSRARAKEAPTTDEVAAVWMQTAKLKPWPDNPRLLDDAAIDRVAKSIERFGFGAPIVARKANLEIIAGHARFLAATKLKLVRVPVRLLDVSAEDAHLLAVADNRYTEMVEWSPDLQPLLSALDADRLALVGWTEKELAKLRAHNISEGSSEEIDLNGIAGERFEHKCPQCGCEFN